MPVCVCVRVNAGNKNTPSTHHPRKRNVTTLMVGLKKKPVTYAKISPKMVNPRDIAGERQKKKKKKKKSNIISSLKEIGL